MKEFTTEKRRLALYEVELHKESLRLQYSLLEEGLDKKDALIP